MSDAATPTMRERAAPSHAWRRRIVTVPVVLALAAVLWTLAPVWLAIAAVVDAVQLLRGRRAASARVVLFGMVYAAAEVVGIVALGAAALFLRGEARVAQTARIQNAWTHTLFRAVCRIFRITLHVEGDACITPGPVVVLVRHASIIDTLLPAVLFGVRSAMRLRFVLKRELLVDPCLDIAGHILPNHFAARGAQDTAGDVDALRALANGMGGGDAAVIFPEGTRFTRSKQARALEQLAQRSPTLHASAASLRHVLPPKPAGTFALVDGCANADVIVLAHTGLEGFATVADIWRGALNGRDVHVKLWRIARAQLPAMPEQTAWLMGQWRDVDDWIHERSKAQGVT